MSDRAPASFTIYNVVGREVAVATVFSDYGFGTEFETNTSQVDEVRDGATFVADEASLGVLWDLGAELEELGVSYRANQDAKYEYNASVRMFTPELGSIELTGSQDGDVLVRASAVDELVATLARYASATLAPSDPPLEDLVASLYRLTGHAWTTALDALAARCA